jgi:hypothetical protein
MGKFFIRGIEKWHFLPACANLAAPTAPEIAAGTPLTPRIATTNGFTASSGSIDAPDADSRFTSNIPGPLTPVASSITFNDDDAVSDPDPMRTLLADQVTGFILIARKGMGTGKPAQVWPIRSGGPNDEHNWDNAPARFTADVFHPAEPEKNALLP